MKDNIQSQVLEDITKHDNVQLGISEHELLSLVWSYNDSIYNGCPRYEEYVKAKGLDNTFSEEKMFLIQFFSDEDKKTSYIQTKEGKIYKLIFNKERGCIPISKKETKEYIEELKETISTLESKGGKAYLEEKLKFTLEKFKNYPEKGQFKKKLYLEGLGLKRKLTQNEVDQIFDEAEEQLQNNSVEEEVDEVLEMLKKQNTLNEVGDYFPEARPTIDVMLIEPDNKKYNIEFLSTAEHPRLIDLSNTKTQTKYKGSIHL